MLFRQDSRNGRVHNTPPKYCCHECGVKHSKLKGYDRIILEHAPTYFLAVCAVCKLGKQVTHERAYGYLDTTV